ncbi:MAG TPA: hypothetical protein VF753_06745 [Terriglobales bacterium]
MAKQHFFFKLIPPRATFPYDIAENEKRLMEDHKHYCMDHFNRGTLLAYGPVMAKDGAFGMAVLEVDARRFGDGDPSVIGGLNRFEIYPMHLAAARAKAS